MTRVCWDLISVNKWLDDNNTGLSCTSDVYTNARTPMDFVCESGHIFHARWDNIKGGGTRCPHCAGKARKTLDDIHSWLHSNSPTLKVISETYDGAHSPLRVRCEVCQVGWTTTWGNLSQGHGCPTCSNVKKKTPQDTLLSVITSFGFIPQQGKVHTHKQLHLTCPYGHDFTTRVDHLRRGSGCPRCLHKTETYVHSLLLGHYKEVLPQYPIHNVPDHIRKSGKVFIDFFIPKATLFVEYHGKQHYEFVPLFHGNNPENLRIQQDRDWWVREYCKKHSINHIEIPYWETNIEDLLYNEIKRKVIE